MYFREYRKRPVQWNGLNISLTNTLCQQNVNIYACSITIVEFRVKLIDSNVMGAKKCPQNPEVMNFAIKLTTN